MTGTRLSYPDFRNELLLSFAILVEGDFDKPALAMEASKLVAGRFQSSWIEAAAFSLTEEELLRVTSEPTPDDPFSIYASGTVTDRLREMSSQSGERQKHYSLTEKGYYEASRIARSKGSDLEEEMDALIESGQLDSSTSEIVRDRSIIVDVLPGSTEMEKIETALNDAIAKVGASNALMDDSEGSQRHAELKAGKALLSGKRLDVRLFKSTVIPALKWLLKKVTDESASMAIQTAISVILLWIATIGG